MNETVRQTLEARLVQEEADREKKRAELQRVFESYKRLADQFVEGQQRIDDLRAELGLGLENRTTVTPPELEAVA